MREKGLLDLMDVVIDPSFIKQVMEYPNSGKLNPFPHLLIRMIVLKAP